MPVYNFDEVIPRRGTGSLKWEIYDADVLPLWVADMDFRSPEPVLRALHDRVDHGVFGYQFAAPDLTEAIIERSARLYNWTVTGDQIIYLPGVVSGLHVVSRAVGAPGDAVLVQTPVYPPFLSAPVSFDRQVISAPLVPVISGADLRYEIDFDAFEQAITPQTRLFLLCNPHNPVGRVFSRAELERLADICLRHDLIIGSDEIHADLLFDGHRHIPMASLSPEVAARTITLTAPSKTYNIPGLACGYAVVQQPELFKRVQHIAMSTAGHVSALGYTAAAAAYREGGDWLAAALAYLASNRDFVADYVTEFFPNVPVTRPEGTYLAWLDWRAFDLPGGAYRFFLEQARVALQDGAVFGEAGRGFIRLNFGASRAVLNEALDRMRSALSRI